ncbi:sensor histidine kinase [Winogradskyella thalassocola]|uniref:Histidine kinase n=1 Tax=Winogradskyella thalassocola TaxID=262004 RepID=A0A1G8D4J6_9FLAO|nr:sensor histidine kinase [Winogradskyella thalassocola]SDH52718.1 Histidine kinase [Winogradskyella thalassocola]
MNRKRFFFYLLIATLVLVVNFLKDAADETPLDPVKYFPYICIILAFAWSIYYLRFYLVKLPFLNSPRLKKNNYYRWVWLCFILLKSFIFSYVAATIAEVASPGERDVSITGVFFWATFTAVFCIVLFVYMLEAFFESETEKQAFTMKLNEIENERTIAQYHALKNQLNPHFLFNSFNSLYSLMTIDIEKAEHFLQELSNVYRYNLDHSEELVVSLKNEMNLIYSYMELQRIRFRESIKITYNINSNKLVYLVPPMTLELLIENAIKHNVVEKTRPLIIEVYTDHDAVVVKNNYQPRKDVKLNTSLGIGNKNLINQYKLIHDSIPTFEIIDDAYVARIPLIQPSI